MNEQVPTSGSIALYYISKINNTVNIEKPFEVILILLDQISGEMNLSRSLKSQTLTTQQVPTINKLLLSLIMFTTLNLAKAFAK